MIREKIKRKMTCSISGSFHGPLSERIQPPLSVQVQVPPKKSGSSLVDDQMKATQSAIMLEDISQEKVQS